MTDTPQFSDDRQYWWNGTEWRPASEYHGVVPPPVAPSTIAAPGKKRHPFIWGCGGILGLLLLTGICVAAANSGNGSKPASVAKSTPTPAATTPAATRQPAVPPAGAPAATPTPPGPQFLVIHDGNWRVGQDVHPGTYRTRSGSPGCYMARLKGFSGQLSDIAANENTSGPAVVTIAPDDKGFKSTGCATWTSDLSQITKSKTTWGEGDFIIGTDIQPGTYRSSGTGPCYFARLGGFSHELGDVRANDNTNGPTVVTIAADDKGFSSTGCGTWSPG